MKTVIRNLTASYNEENKTIDLYVTLYKPDASDPRDREDLVDLTIDIENKKINKVMIFSGGGNQWGCPRLKMRKMYENNNCLGDALEHIDINRLCMGLEEEQHEYTSAFIDIVLDFDGSNIKFYFEKLSDFIKIVFSTLEENMPPQQEVRVSPAPPSFQP